MMSICSAVTVNEYGDTMTQLIRDNNDPNFPVVGALVGSAIIGSGIGVLTNLLYNAYFPVKTKKKPVVVLFSVHT